jgi:hypothetical protein
VSALTPSSFDLDDVRYRHLDPVRLAGTTLHEGHVLFDLYEALKEIQRLEWKLLQTERERDQLRAEGERLNGEVELLRAENRALGEQTTSEETRADIVRWMRKTADQYAEQSELVGHGLANVWRIIATLIAEERDLPSVVEAWRPERCTETWTQAGWPYREVQCDREEGHTGSHSAAVVGSTMASYPETRP